MHLLSQTLLKLKLFFVIIVNYSHLIMKNNINLVSIYIFLAKNNKIVEVYDNFLQTFLGKDDNTTRRISL